MIDQITMKCVKFKKKLLFLACMMIPVFSFANDNVVNGTVTDQFGEPLPGVSVVVKGSMNGTATDTDGKFNLKAGNGNVIVFSYIGFKNHEITFNGQKKIAVTLTEDLAKLDEIVVIGYGQQRKNDATGSITSIDEEVFNKGAISSPQELIMGKSPGVTVTTGSGAPGAGATIRIRGGSSLSASNDPLVVIDGVPIDNDGVAGMSNPLSMVNPNDIASMTILKDASATAIYGSRASNGVILITTKTGSKNTPFRLNYSGKFYMNTVGKTLDVMSGDEFREMIRNQFGSNQQAQEILNQYPDVNTNWQEEIFQNSFGQDHNLSFSGSLKNLPYRFSYGYTDEDGILKTSSMKRNTLSLNLTPSFFDDHLKVTLNAKGMFIKQQFADNGAIGQAIAYDPTKPLRAEGFDKYGGFHTWTQANGAPNTIGTRNPMATLELKEDLSDVKRFVGNAAIDYKFHFLPDLKANLNIGMDYSKSDGVTNEREQAAWTQYDIQQGFGSFKNYDQEKSNKLLEFYLNYDKELPSLASRLNVMGGYSYQNFWRRGAERIHALAADGSGKKIDRSNSDYESEYTLVSFYGRLNYTLKDRYMLTFTMRGDGSSRFSSDNRWGAFPSVAAAWRMNEENFMKGFTKLSNLKFRFGYGITGQQDIVGNDYPYMPRYTWGDDKTYYPFGHGNFVTTLRPEGYDANIKWEETTTYNAGIDFGFYKNRINGTIDVYKRTTSDLINNIPIPAGSNLSNKITTNVGSLENTGIELGLNFVPVQTKDWHWDFGVNATYNKNQITKLTVNDDPKYIGVPTGGIDGGTGNNIQMNSVGRALQSYYVFEQVYDQSGKPIEGLYADRNGDGQITDADKYHYKKAAPDWNLGFNTSVRYRNWDFSLAARSSIGNYVYNNAESSKANYSLAFNNTGFLMNLPSAVINTGFSSSQVFSDYYVQNASYLKLDNITLGYTFDKLFTDKLDARLYFTAQNVWTLTDYSGLDPEIYGGIDNNFYPRPRTFLLGLNVNF